MTWATVNFLSCFCSLYRASPSLVAKNTPHPRAKEKPQQDSWRAKSRLESNPIPARDAWRAQTKSCVYQETPQRLSQTCLWGFECLLWRFTRPRTNTKKRCPFHHRELECKSRKSGDAWSNRQVWPWSTKWSRTKANRAFPREHTNRRKHSLSTTQETALYMDITRWSIPKSYWLYSLQPKMEKLYTVSKNKTRSWVWLRSWTPYCKIQTSVEESRKNH